MFIVNPHVDYGTNMQFVETKAEHYTTSALPSFFTQILSVAFITYSLFTISPNNGKTPYSIL